MTNDWVLDNESRIFTIIYGMCIAPLRTLFPKVRFTTSDETPVTQFPTVYIHELGNSELGRDTEQNVINVITTTFEVRVTVNTEKADAVTIMKYLLNAFKEFGFEGYALPATKTEDGMYISTARFRGKVTNGVQ